MKITFWLSKLLLASATLFFLNSAQAGIPVWTFDPVTDTEISISTSGTAIIQYVITNQSRRAHLLAMKPIRGINQITGPSYCAKLFTLGSRKSCTLTLQVIGRDLQKNVIGGPSVCEQNNPLECYQPGSEDILKITLFAEPGATTLSTSVSTLALKTSGLTRIITITNTGTETATNVVYRLSPALPAGTTITPSRCGTIAPGGSCILRVTPGATPSAAPGNTNPTPITLTITGDNTNTLTPTLNILTYGSVYQSGFIFAIDDTTLNTRSIGGKVAALENQADFTVLGAIWSSDNGGNPVFDAIPGIYQDSFRPIATCNGATEGACNTNVIVTYYSPPQTNPAINLSLYAAGLCKATIGGFSDWYLPSICEMGFDTAAQGTGCGIPPLQQPTLQNMQTNLVDNGNIGGLFGPFWSSTESSRAGNTTDNAWDQFFDVGGNSFQDDDGKEGSISVRCVRVLTN